MNWEHLRAFLWLRWRLRVNQNKRAGAANVWIQRVILFFGFAAAGVMLLGSFLVGLLAMTKASPTVLMDEADKLCDRIAIVDHAI